ncbi:hypothetical protein [Streptomyces nitrosporeus]|nr:hypothetical protein [Streptomyces nitrosporeus]GGY95480.1 hypothetical protein GCM10010327_27800 [Streptomyces nitrosporeus]
MIRTLLQRGPVRAVTNVLLALAMSLGVTAAVAPAAAAAPALQQVDCWTPQANGEGRGYNTIQLYLRVGPYSACGINPNAPVYMPLPAGNTLFFHCWTINSYGNVWWYVRVEGTGWHGWISDDNLVGTSVDENGDGQIIFYQC